MYKAKEKLICLKAIVNKRNNQINFSLKKSELPKRTILQLPKLKGIKFDVNNMEFE